MKRFFKSMMLIIICFFSLTVKSQEKEKSSQIYTFKKGDFNGIGKWYLGRDNIADIGAGSGYHVFKMAPIANKGAVYAVDIQPEMLNAILQNPKFEQNTNIELVQGDEKSVNLPKNTFDKVLMVDVYHEFNFPKEMIISIKEALKENGKIYLIEYRLEDESVPIKTIHKMSEKQAVKELNAAGFRLEKNINNLPWQHCMVFVKQ